MRDPELPPNTEKTADGVIDAVVQTIKDPKLTVAAAREMAAADPTHAIDAREAAFKAYPDDPVARAAYLSGTEFQFLKDRQVSQAQELEALLEEPSAEPEPKRRRWLGARALLAFGLFAKPPRTS